MASLDGLHPTLMRPRVEALLADPEAKAHGVILVSGWRSTQRQTELWNAAVRRYGSEEAADNWVARPGTSRHETKSAARLLALGYTSAEVGGEPGAVAVDLGVSGLRAVSGQWPAHVNAWFVPLAARHGLATPLEWEDWHHEPIKGWKAPEEDDMPLTDEDIIRIAKAVRGEVDAEIKQALTETPMPYIKDGQFGLTGNERKFRGLISRMAHWLVDIRGDVEAIKKKLGA